MDRTKRPPRIRTCRDTRSTDANAISEVDLFWLQFYALYLRIFYGSTVARQRQLKSDILLNKKELLQTSAQDQFAKWAKLRRSLDKGLADLEKISE